MSTPNQAMILAAGRGTRLGPLGERRAKALVEIDGTPLLAHQLTYLAGEGVKRVVVNASHLAEQVEELAAAHTAPPELEVVVEEEPLGTAGGVRNALPLLSSDPLLVLYGDVISAAPLAPIGELHRELAPLATLAVYHSDSVGQKGVVELDGTRITAFHEKDPSLAKGWVNAGIYMVEPDWVASFEQPAPLDFGFDLFPAALASGGDLRAHRLDRPVLDIGTPADLQTARERGLPTAP